MKIFYGDKQTFVDITDTVFEKCKHLGQSGQYIIPANDVRRAKIFGDPLYGVVKKIVIITDEKTQIFDHNDEILITLPNTVSIIESPISKLNKIHKNLKFLGGRLTDELPEQLMVVKFLDPNSKVLELGSNIGRNTLVISSILNNDSNLVTCESDVQICHDLEINKNINNMKFNIENSALSYRNLIQKGWDTIPSDTLLPGYKQVNTVTFEQLEEKYAITFDTLVVDCEGALYYILKDKGDILKNIKMVIMENDYWEIEKKVFVDKMLESYNFGCIYREAGGWGPCFDYFFQVWKKNE